MWLIFLGTCPSEIGVRLPPLTPTPSNDLKNQTVMLLFNQALKQKQLHRCDHLYALLWMSALSENTYLVSGIRMVCSLLQVFRFYHTLPEHWNQFTLLCLKPPSLAIFDMPRTFWGTGSNQIKFFSSQDSARYTWLIMTQHSPDKNEFKDLKENLI